MDAERRSTLSIVRIGLRHGDETDMKPIAWTRGFALSTLVLALGIACGYALVDWANWTSATTSDATFEAALQGMTQRDAEQPGGVDTPGEVAAAKPEAGAESRKSGWELFVFILTRNIAVYFWLLAGLLSAGAITFFVLLMNGVMLGQIIAAATWAGVPAWALCHLLLPHGVLELGAFCIAGAAGFQGFRFAFGRLKANREGIRALRLGLVAAFGLCALGLAAGVEAFVTAELSESLHGRAHLAAAQSQVVGS